MESPALAIPNRETGLPPGVEVAPLGKRFVAYLIDISVPVVVSAFIGLFLPTTSGGLRIGLSVVSALVTLAWVLLLWFRLATRAATPGMRVMKLQLVGFYDGRPIGLARALIRGVILWLVTSTFIVLIVMVIMLILHPRKQGWHDLASKSVMIKERTLAPAPPATPAAAVTAAPQGGSQQGYAPPPGYSPQQRYPQQQAPQRYQPQYAPQQVPPQGYQPQSAPSATPLAPPPGYGAPAGFPGAQQPPRLAPPSGTPAYPPPAVDPLSAPTPGPVSGSSPTDQTQVSAPAASPSGSPASPAWIAVLDDGREISIDGLVLLGRNPQPQPGEEDAQLIKVADETRTVSKSHLAIGIDAGGLFVVDRGSTNGSTVTTADGVSTRCRTGDIIYVTEDSIVSIGDHWLKIRRG